MARLFADYFTVPVVDPERSAPEPIYDEGRELSLDADGRVFVERTVAGGVSRTETITKVRKERPDITDEMLLLETETRMRPSEREHRDEGLAGLETLTEVRGEREDPTSLYSGADILATETAVRGERPDIDTATAIELGTKTAVPREGEDRIPEVFIGTGTQTFVRGEREDLAREPGGPVEPVRIAV